MLVGITLGGELIGLPQPFTGPFVNAMLLLSVLLLNIQAGCIIGCFSPLMAVIRGQLPPVFVPIVPFIIIGNCLLVVLFGLIIRREKIFVKNKNVIRIVAIFIAAFVKFIWLSASVTIFLPLFFGVTFPEKAAYIFMLPQLLSALAGGLFALLFYSLLRRIGIILS